MLDTVLRVCSKCVEGGDLPRPRAKPRVGRLYIFRPLRQAKIHTYITHAAKVLQEINTQSGLDAMN